jgi:hypothetical protein
MILSTLSEVSYKMFGARRDSANENKCTVLYTSVVTNEVVGTGQSQQRSFNYNLHALTHPYNDESLRNGMKRDALLLIELPSSLSLVYFSR